jgi:hypothetical protein
VRKPSDESVALYASIFFAFWLFVVLPFLYTVPRYDRQHENVAGKCSPEQSQHHGFWEKTDCDPVAYFTLWLVGFTGVLAVSTIGLWIVTWRSVQLARDEFYSTHRPKIRIKHLWLENDIWHDEPIAATLTLVNVGTVEATLRQVGIRYEVVGKDRPLPPIPTIEPFYYSEAKIACGLNYPLPKIENGPTLTKEEAFDILQERSQLYCIGYVSYQDNAGRTRITGFCRVLTFPKDFIAHLDSGRFRVFDDPDYEYED